VFELGELRGVHEQLAGYTAGFDAALVSAAQAIAVVDEAARIEKMAATLKALAAARVADAGLAGDDGALNPAHALALVDEVGKRAMVAPDDSRHPRHRSIGVTARGP
jgi:hypothetical protein